MIYVGYPGIGKSTLANLDNKFIDLEVTDFDVEGVRIDNWCVIYCNVAEDLSRQGFKVFVSSHEAVRDRLQISDEKICVIVPSLSLEDKWIDKLYDRYLSTRQDKDWSAYWRAHEYYEDDVKAVLGSFYDHIIIDYMDYDLQKLIRYHNNTAQAHIANIKK